MLGALGLRHHGRRRRRLAAVGRIGLYFAEAGAFVFGSGLAIVPFLHGGVVNQHHWLTERQFLDAVAVAMITPGPVVITVAFIGYLVAGPLGASSRRPACSCPATCSSIIPAPYFRRFADNPRVRAFVDGVTAAATGAIAGAAFVLGRRALIDWKTVAIAVATWLVFTPGEEAARAAGHPRGRAGGADSAPPLRHCLKLAEPARPSPGSSIKRSGLGEHCLLLSRSPIVDDSMIRRSTGAMP